MQKSICSVIRGINIYMFIDMHILPCLIAQYLTILHNFIQNCAVSSQNIIRLELEVNVTLKVENMDNSGKFLIKKK